MNELQVFTHPDFGSLEVWIGPDGKPWFPAKESAQLLRYSNDRDAIITHCDEAGVAFRDVSHPSGTKKKKYINRPNLSRLIARSHLPEAAKFERWIFDDVIESVFDHGAYMTPDTLDRMIASPEFGIKLLSALKDEREKNQRLTDTVAVQTQQIAELQPKASYYDTILQNKSLLPISVIAKDYGMSAKRMNVLLHEKGVQFKQGDIWLLYQPYAKMGYTQTKTHAIDAEHSRPHTNWTQKGRLFIYDLLKRDGILPLIEQNHGQPA